jgi:hypothetical protein
MKPVEEGNMIDLEKLSFPYREEKKVFQPCLYDVTGLFLYALNNYRAIPVI